MMKPTDTKNPDYYHKVVDCQWACPAHTPVPEYIRLIAQRKYTEAYMVNWESNVFPGVLGRTCDRPCEPACRRVRVEEEPVAICRLKRVAADNKSDITDQLPIIPSQKNLDISRLLFMYSSAVNIQCSFLKTFGKSWMSMTGSCNIL